jgi:hypothetical protein
MDEETGSSELPELYSKCTNCKAPKPKTMVPARIRAGRATFET